MPRINPLKPPDDPSAELRRPEGLKEVLCGFVDEACSDRDRDLRQDVLMVCLRKMDAGAERAGEVRSWALWARGVAWRLSYAGRRERTYQARAEAARGISRAAEHQATPVEYVLGVERRDAVRNALASLPPHVRSSVVRVDMNDEPYGAVARDLYGRDDGSARRRLGTLLSRARVKLREALARCAPEASRRRRAGPPSRPRPRPTCSLNE